MFQYYLHLLAVKTKPLMHMVMGTRKDQDAVEKTITYCQEKVVVNPVEILRCLQNNMVTGRGLDVENPTQSDNGSTNFIMIDRSNLLSTAFDEIKILDNLRLTQEVEFYNEVYTVIFFLNMCFVVVGSNTKLIP